MDQVISIIQERFYMILWWFFLLIFFFFVTLKIYFWNLILRMIFIIYILIYISWIPFHTVNLIYNLILQSSWHRVSYSKSSLLTFIDRQSCREFLNCIILRVVRVSNFFFDENLFVEISSFTKIKFVIFFVNWASARNMIRFYWDHDRSLLLVVSIRPEWNSMCLNRNFSIRT